MAKRKIKISEDLIDIKVAQDRLKSAEYVADKEMESYLRKRGIRILKSIGNSAELDYN